MSFFGERRRRGGDQNQNEKNDYEYYEDTHSMNGYGQPVYPAPESHSYSNADMRANEPRYESGPKNLSDIGAGAARNYQNVVVYKPTTPDDVQTLIDFLKRREPAIINLDDVEAASAQRVLDFVSGATYALNGSIHRIAGNIFLLSPEGVEVAVTYEDK